MSMRNDGEGARWFGLYPALVTDLVDPDGRGRIEVKFPSFGEAGQSVRAWATLLSPYADKDQGLQILPEVDSQVVVGFEAGDPTRPYIVGACWNGQASLPEMAQAPNNKRLIKSRAGSLFEFDDSQGAAKVTVSMQSGHELVLDDAAQSVTIKHSNGCEIVMNIAGQVSITANATVEITASAVNVHAPTVMCDGIVQCTTLIATSVVSSSYTPGAGNIW
ncbi:phage baseplate assembly protein V [Chitinimonas taiwanensis]|uniref:phage baseplate assembly protein V n=1 Tax=Chitinimonas taiwanensis TaxID=240412 RepID=UPI0035B013D8